MQQKRNKNVQRGFNLELEALLNTVNQPWDDTNSSAWSNVLIVINIKKYYCWTVLGCVYLPFQSSSRAKLNPQESVSIVHTAVDQTHSYSFA